MTTVSYKDQTASAAERYERDFVPAIGGPIAEVTLDALDPQPGERILDVACGTGIVARRAAERGAIVTGLDIAPDMIDVARRVTPSIDWHVGDATSLPFDDDAFDAAVCQMGLMFVAERDRAVAELARVASDRVVVVTPGPIQPLLESLERAIVDNISADLGGFVRAVFSMPDPDAVAALLRDAGLHDVTATLRSARLQLPPPAEFLWQYINLTPMAPFVEQASAAAKAAMERQFVAEAPAYDGAVEQPGVVAVGLSG